MQYKDYYKILGLPRNSTAEDIKKKYRELAKQYHPDRNPNNPLAEKRFKDITEAHDVLGDPSKRRQYDLMGKNWDSYKKYADQAKTKFDIDNDFEFKDLFNKDKMSSIFKNVVDFGKETILKNEKIATPKKSKPKQIDTQISLDEAYSGTTRIITVEDSRIRLKLKAGVKDRQTLRLKEQGEKKQDVLVTVHIDAHPDFERKDDDLHTTAKVSLYEAMLGGKISVPTMQGKILFPIAAETPNGKIFRIKGKGMPIQSQTDKFGDLYIKIEVVLPQNLSSREKELFEQLAYERN